MNDRMVRGVLFILAAAIVVYLVGWNLSTELSTPTPTLTTAALQSRAVILESELSTIYSTLTKRYVDQGNLAQATEAVRKGLQHDPNNIDLLRLQADLQTNY